MNIKKIVNEEGFVEIHLFDDESRKSFLKIGKALKKLKNIKIQEEIDGIHYLKWYILIDKGEIQFVHHDDIGNYFIVGNQEDEFALESLLSNIK